MINFIILVIWFIYCIYYFRDRKYQYLGLDSIVWVEKVPQMFFDSYSTLSSYVIVLSSIGSILFSSLSAFNEQSNSTKPEW